MRLPCGRVDPVEALRSHAQVRAGFRQGAALLVDRVEVARQDLSGDDL